MNKEFDKLFLILRFCTFYVSFRLKGLYSIVLM